MFSNQGLIHLRAPIGQAIDLVLVRERMSESMKAKPMGLDPELWKAANEKAGGPTQLRATIRELTRLWVAGEVEPWGEQ